MVLVEPIVAMASTVLLGLTHPLPHAVHDRGTLDCKMPADILLEALRQRMCAQVRENSVLNRCCLDMLIVGALRRCMHMPCLACRRPPPPGPGPQVTVTVADSDRDGASGQSS